MARESIVIQNNSQTRLVFSPSISPEYVLFTEHKNFTSDSILLSSGPSDKAYSPRQLGGRIFFRFSKFYIFMALTAIFALI